jgi:hypothetical protein
LTTTDQTEVSEARFTALVASSWKRHNAWEYSRRADDIALGATITSYVSGGWRLIDLESDGTAHMVRFQAGNGTDRLLVRLTALCEDPVRAKALGRLVQVEVAYGVRANDFSAIKQAIKDELKSSMVANSSEPGVITVDGDVSTGYVYASVPLILDLDDYFEGFTQKTPIVGDLHAAAHSLHKYLMGRLAG